MLYGHLEFVLDDPLDEREGSRELLAARRALRRLPGYLGHCTVDARGAIDRVDCTRGDWFIRAAADYTIRHIALDGLAGVRPRAVGRYLHTLALMPGRELLLIVQERRAAAPELTRRAAERVLHAARRVSATAESTIAAAPAAELDRAAAPS